MSLTCMACLHDWPLDAEQVLFTGSETTMLYTVCPSCHMHIPLSTTEVMSLVDERS